MKKQKRQLEELNERKRLKKGNREFKEIFFGPPTNHIVPKSLGTISARKMVFFLRENNFKNLFF